MGIRGVSVEYNRQSPFMNKKNKDKMVFYEEETDFVM